VIVYKITNTVNGKVYVGQTTKPEIEIRWKQHIWFSQARNQRTYKSALQNAIRKYGADKFTIEFLHRAKTRKELNAMETFFILLHQSHDPENGYNMTLGGENLGYWTGKKRSQASIDKQMATKRENGTTSPAGWNRDPIVIARRVATRKARKNYGIHRLGKKHSAATVEKIRAAALQRSSKRFSKSPI
jgi:group I intron endonuclease